MFIYVKSYVYNTWLINLTDKHVLHEAHSIIQKTISIL